MAYVLIASTSKAAAGGNDAVTTDAINVTGANLIAVGVCYTSGGVGAISDSESNSYSTAKQTVGAGTAENFVWFYKQAPTLGTPSAFTVTLGAQAVSYQTVYVYAFSGAASSPLDQTNESFATVGETSRQPGSVTPTEDNELILAGIGFSNSSGGASIDGGFATPIAIDTATTMMPSAVSYLIQTSLAAANPTWSWTNSVRGVANIITFKATSVTTTPELDHTSSHRPFNMAVSPGRM